MFDFYFTNPLGKWGIMTLTKTTLKKDKSRNLANQYNNI